jgi:hypothetical protein
MEYPTNPISSNITTASDVAPEVSPDSGNIIVEFLHSSVLDTGAAPHAGVASSSSDVPTGSVSNNFTVALGPKSTMNLIRGEIFSISTDGRTLTIKSDEAKLEIKDPSSIPSITCTGNSSEFSDEATLEIKDPSSIPSITCTGNSSEFKAGKRSEEGLRINIKEIHFTFLGGQKMEGSMPIANDALEHLPEEDASLVGEVAASPEALEP